MINSLSDVLKLYKKTDCGICIGSRPRIKMLKHTKDKKCYLIEFIEENIGLFAEDE